jgi:hypothetical protein
LTPARAVRLAADRRRKKKRLSPDRVSRSNELFDLGAIALGRRVSSVAACAVLFTVPRRPRRYVALLVVVGRRRVTTTNNNNNAKP